MALTGCELLGIEWRYRYRLTATLQRGSERRSGSSVIEIVRSKGYTGIGGSIDGEATVVDVPGVGALFVLLTGPNLSPDYPIYLPHYAFAKLGLRDMVNGEVLDRLTQMVGTRASLPREFYPILVRLRDPNDPVALEKVEPDEVPNEFAGFRLTDITIEITDAPVSRSIYSKLPWLKGHRGALVKPDLTMSAAENPFAANVTRSFFVQG